jgi:hypothetical protein
MTEVQIVDKIREAAGIEPPSTLGRRSHSERRHAQREPPKTLEDAHANVQAIAKRQVENDDRVKAWRFAKHVSYLFALVGAFLLYYLMDKMIEANSLSSIAFY